MKQRLITTALVLADLRLGTTGWGRESKTSCERPSAIPSLEEMAGDWLPMTKVANRPQYITSTFCGAKKSRERIGVAASPETSRKKLSYDTN